MRFQKLALKASGFGITCDRTTKGVIRGVVFAKRETKNTQTHNFRVHFTMTISSTKFSAVISVRAHKLSRLFNFLNSSFYEHVSISHPGNSRITQRLRHQHYATPSMSRSASSAMKVPGHPQQFDLVPPGVARLITVKPDMSLKRLALTLKRHLRLSN